MLLYFCKAIFACLPDKGCVLRRANNFGELFAVFSCNYHLTLNDIHKKGGVLMRAGSAFGPVESIQISSMDWHVSIKKWFERLPEPCWIFIGLCIKSRTSMTDSIHILKHRKTKLGLFFPGLLKNYAQIENLEGLPLHQVVANYQFSEVCLDAYGSSSWAAGTIYFLTHL